MKKATVLLMLFVMGIALCPKGAVFAEEDPEEEIPELFNSVAQILVIDITPVNLEEEPEPEPEPEPESAE